MCLLCSLTSLTEHIAFAVQLLACIGSVFISVAENSSILWGQHSLFTHPPTEGHLGGFQCFVSVAEAAINIPVQAFV